MEKIRYIKKNNYPSALEFLKSELNSREFSPDEYYVILTPDRYTQSVERAVFSGGGAIDCEVLTISRLARRIADNKKTVTREGSVMLVARAIDDVKDKLVYYKRAVRFVDFARDVYDTFAQIAASDEDIRSMAATGATGSKLQDLALIKAAYDKRKAEYLDASDRITALIDAVPTSPLITASHVYMIGYSMNGDGMTKLNRRFANTVKAHARSFTYIEAEYAKMRDTLDVISSPDDITEYKEVAVRIRDAVDRGGANYGDISVICPAPRALTRILKEFEIPFYADESVMLSDTPPLAALSAIYKLKSTPDSETVVALCKNPFSGCDERDAEQLQNYYLTHGMTYDVFNKEIKDAPGAVRALERAKLLTDAFTGDFAHAVTSVIETGKFEEIREKFFGDTTDTVTPIASLTELLGLYGTGDFKKDAECFFAAARAVDVKSLPRAKNRVTVTTADALRMTACKLLFVVDFNEGVLPAVTADNGLISDGEIRGLGNVGIEIEPTARDINRRAREQLRAVVCNAERVICMYSVSGGKRRAVFINDLAKKINFHSAEEYRMLLKLSGVDDPDIEEEYRDGGEMLSLYACTESAAREIAARHLSYHAPSVLCAVGDCRVKSQPFVETRACGKPHMLSVSELSSWFKCPYKRFLDYDVRVGRRKTGELSSLDFGVIVHRFMEKFFGAKPYDCSREAVEKLIDEALAEKDIEADEETRERLINDGIDFAELNVDILSAGNYAVLENEFKKITTLGSDTYPFEFMCKIDRIDVLRDENGKNTYRIIDYKTYDKKFTVRSCLDGTDMQLPLYAAAFDRDDTTGYFYITFVRKFSDDKPMRGRLIKDISAIRQHDGEFSTVFDETGKSQCRYMSVSGTTGKNGFYIYPGCRVPIGKEEFSKLIDVCEATAARGAKEIYEGYIARSPQGDACSRCAYFGICGNDKKYRSFSAGDGEGE